MPLSYGAISVHRPFQFRHNQRPCSASYKTRALLFRLYCQLGPRDSSAQRCQYEDIFHHSSAVREDSFQRSSASSLIRSTELVQYPRTGIPRKSNYELAVSLKVVRILWLYNQEATWHLPNNFPSRRIFTISTAWQLSNMPLSPVMRLKI